MRKVLTALAGAALAVTLSAPAVHAASSAHPANHRCRHGIVGALVEWLL